MSQVKKSIADMTRDSMSLLKKERRVSISCALDE